MKRKLLKDLTWLGICFEISELSTCVRRGTGAVLLDQYGRVLSTSHNGVAAGDKHCTQESPCAGARAASGTQLGACEAIHAEENALLHCPDVQKIHTIYCTTSPCVDRCLRKLKNTSAVRVVFANQYPDPDNIAKNSWESSRAGRTWECIPLYSRLWLTADLIPEGLYYRRRKGQAWTGDIVKTKGPEKDDAYVYQALKLPSYDRKISYD